MFYSFDNTRLEDPTIPAGERTNEELMEQIKQGDETALEQLFVRHGVLLRTIVSRVGVFDADCNDVIQDCMLDVWKHAKSFDAAKGHAIGWLVTLGRRRGIDRVRRNGAYHRAQERARADSAGDAEILMQSGADEEAHLGDQSAVISRLIDRLPEPQRVAIRLTYFHGMSQREIAKHTGIPLGTIKTRLELGMRKLKSAVLAFGELHEGVPPIA